MNVLIVESREELGGLWSRHLARLGATVLTARTEEEATARLLDGPVDIIVLDLVLDEGSAIAVADFANYRQPGAKVIFVTNTSFFSDGLDLPAVQQRLRLSAKRDAAGGSGGDDRAFRPARAALSPAQAALSASRPCGAIRSRSGPTGMIRFGLIMSWL